LRAPPEELLLDELEELELEELELEELVLDELELLLELCVPGLLGAEPPQAAKLRLRTSVNSPGTSAWRRGLAGKGARE